jgi:hypothetical protein
MSFPHTCPSPRIELTPLDERMHLLRLGPIDIKTIPEHSWVRVKRGRRYKNALALVVAVNAEKNSARLLVLPRP